MRQRVMISLGLSCYPQLLMDGEPTTPLDVTIQVKIADLVTRLRKAICKSVGEVEENLQ